MQHSDVQSLVYSAAVKGIASSLGLPSLGGKGIGLEDLCHHITSGRRECYFMPTKWQAANVLIVQWFVARSALAVLPSSVSLDI